MGQQYKYEMKCDGLINGEPCPVVFNGDLIDENAAIPVPEHWTRITGMAEVGLGGGAGTGLPLQSNNTSGLCFHSVECVQSFFDGALSDFLTTNSIAQSDA